MLQMFNFKMSGKKTHEDRNKRQRVFARALHAGARARTLLN